MIVKSVLLARSPFDSTYENVPDKFDNDGEIIDTLTSYFVNYCKTTVLNVKTNFFDGYSIPLNEKITFNFKTNLDDKDVANYNYVIIVDEETDFKTTIKNKEWGAYFVINVSINNSNNEKSVTLTCIKDVWVTYFNTIYENPNLQKIVRKHYFPFDINGNVDPLFYSADDISELRFSHIKAESDDYIMLSLKILLDPTQDYYFKENDNEVKIDFKTRIDTGNFYEVAIPVAVYNRYGNIVNRITHFNYNDNIENAHQMLFFQNEWKMDNPYIIGAYLTFAKISDYEVRLYPSTSDVYGVAIFTNPNIGIGKLGYKIDGTWYELSIFNDQHVVLNYDNSYDIVNEDFNNYDEEYYRSLTTFENLINVDFETIKKYVPEYYLWKTIPNLKINRVSKKLYGKGKCYLYYYTNGNQNGNRISPIITFGNGQITDDFLDKIYVGQHGYLPLIKDQYTLYMTANMNKENTAISNGFLNFIGDSIKGVQARFDEKLQDVSTAFKIASGNITDFSNLNGANFDIPFKIVNSAYSNILFFGAKHEDLKNALASISGSESAISDFVDLDRVMISIDKVVEDDSFYKLIYNCHLYGTLKECLGKPLSNERFNFDYILIPNLQITLNNENDRITLIKMFSTGLRKIHLENLKTDLINFNCTNNGVIKGGFNNVKFSFSSNIH